MLDRYKVTNPVWCVAFAFALTVVAARSVSYFNPGFHFNYGEIHIHHYVYGIFIMSVAGYLALVFKGPRATFWVALLYGWGLGFIFDEMGMWFNSSTDPTLRWDYGGVMLSAAALMVIAAYSIASKRRVPREDNQLKAKPIDVVAIQQED